MYIYNGSGQTTLRRAQKELGESIENKVNRIVSQKEAINDSAPIIHTDRDDGVLPEYNVRTDKFELAADAMNVVHKNNLAKGAQAQISNEGEPQSKDGSEGTGDE